MTLLKITILVLAVLFAACSKTRTSSSASSSGSSSITTSPSTPTTATDQGLTTAMVEAAVADLLKDWRMGGSISVKGIQEIPQQNSAVADLQFNNFEYGVSFQGGILKVSQFKPPAQSGKAIPPPEEMFPPRKITYSKDGKATLSKYNDGRWVLKAVNWGFDTGIKGNIEVH